MNDKDNYVEKKEIAKYLDGCITHWRKKRNAGKKYSGVAVYYIDAFQSVRCSLLGKVLPIDKKENVPLHPGYQGKNAFYSEPQTKGDG